MALFKETYAYKKFFINPPSTQTLRYVKNNASKEIIALVDTSNKAFGTLIENVARDLFVMETPNDSECDAILNRHRIEIKASRYAAKTGEIRWQHITPSHDFKFLIGVEVGYQNLKFYFTTKDKILSNPLFFTNQGGKNNSQGLWCAYKKAPPPDICTEFTTREELLALIAAEQV